MPHSGPEPDIGEVADEKGERTVCRLPHPGPVPTPAPGVSVQVTEHLLLHCPCAHKTHTTKDSLNSLDLYSGSLMDVFITALLDL